MILLFDIDGTLVSCRGSGRAALSAAIESVVGIADPLATVRLAGNTDPQILNEVFIAARGTPVEPDDPVDAIYTAYLERLAVELVERGVEVMPHADALTQELIAAGDHVVGLATGNIEAGARTKLAAANLDARFAFGGFGSDAGVRAELVAAGIARGRRLNAARGGAPAQEVWVIGDTERDVVAARAAGARSVAVLVGSSRPDLLRAAKPDVLVEDLGAPELRALWGLAGAAAV